ncbi:MAG: glycosyltransferase family 39 protein [Elusimicrobiota bacterium]|jgi:4-amino-4-deoxy-L-arabinose transferase-like glycosyltransferase
MRHKKKRPAQDSEDAAVIPGGPLEEILLPELWIFLFALGVRFAHFRLYHKDFWARTPLLDDNIFVSWRDVLQNSGWLGRSLGVFQLNPGYPYFLAVFGKLFGNGIMAPVVFQHVLGALAAVMLYRIGRDLFDIRVGLLAGLAGAFYGPAVFYESRLLGESFIYFFNLAALFLLCRGAAQAPGLRSFLAGVCLGLSAAFRPTVLAFVPFAALWSLDMARCRGAVRAWICLALLCLGAWLPILPFQLRNRLVDPAHGWGLTTASGGVNLFLGNNPESDGLNKPPAFVRYGPGQQYQDFKEEAERREGRSLSPGEVSSYWTRRVREWFSQRPEAAFRLLGHKMQLFWNHREPPDNFFLSLFERFTRIGDLSLLGWGVIAPLGLWGFFAAFGWMRISWFLHAYVLTYFALNAAFYILSRYRFPTAAGLIPLAAFACVRLWDLASRGPRLKALGLALLLLPCVWLTRRPLIGGEDPASAHYSMGVIYANQGWKEKALEEYRASVSADPSFAASWLNMGLLLSGLGRAQEAAQALENAARFESDPARAQRIREAVGSLKR